MKPCIVFQPSLKSLTFDAVTTPDKKTGLSCLQSACIEGDIETVGAILNHSPDKLYSAIALRCKIGHNATNFAGESIDAVLQQRDSKDHKQICESVENVTKCFESQPLLCLAAREGKVEHLRRLLDCGEYIDSEEYYETPLMLAAKFNEEDVVEFLVERGASFNITEINGFTAFHFAAWGGKTRNIQRLIELGAVSKWDGRNATSPLELAIEGGHTEAVRLLIEHGADIENVNDNSDSAVMIAADMGHLDIIQLLLMYGGNLFEGNSDCLLPLHRAALRGHIDVVKFILQNNGNVGMQTLEGETVLHLASRLELLRFLVEQGADIHARDCRYRTPLHCTASYGQSDKVNFLLNQGADIKALDDDNHSPLYWTLNMGYVDVAKLLIERGADTSNVDSECNSLAELAAKYGFDDLLPPVSDKEN